MWELDSVRTFVTKFSTGDQQIVARLQPLSGASVHQFFGYESPVLKINAFVVGNTDRDAIRSKVRDGTTHALNYNSSPIFGNLIVKNASFDMKLSICQTLRSDLAEDAPVYECEIELWQDE